MFTIFRNICLILSLIFLTLILSAICTLVVVKFFERIFQIEGVVRDVFLVVVYFLLLVVQFRYCFMSQLVEAQGRPHLSKEPPIFVSYLISFLGALFVSEVVVSGFVYKLDGGSFFSGFEVSAIRAFVFLVVYFWLRFRSKK